MLLLLVLIAAALKMFKPESSTTEDMTIRSVDFEVFGRVQGVFFRKYTKDKADKLGLKGWCKNTAQGTVQGQMEGPINQIGEMMIWLSNTGSPSSQIEKAVFKNDGLIKEYTYKDFTIKRE